MRKSFFLVLVCILLNCNLSFASYDKSKFGDYKVGNPYKIGKKEYIPKKYNSLEEEGYISWYGPGFHAKKTANGAKFNKNSYTVAHKTLQMPAVIEITNLENGKKLIAVVNDRGPFSETQHRILDVSEKIAKDLDFLKKGVVRARIKFLPKETQRLMQGKSIKLGLVSNPVKTKEFTPQKQVVSRETTKTDFSQGYLVGVYIQVGVFKNPNNAISVLRKLENDGIKEAKITTEKTKSGDSVEIVRIGPLNEEIQEKTLTKVKNLGYSNARILTLN
jgi:rare lipoprotein A